MKNTRKGFTLIELLVVISIVGMLSSIVLASVQDARQKAIVAGGRQFASSINHVLGADLIGQWNFDETGPAPPPKDYSGHNFNFSQTVLRTNDTPSKTGRAANFSSGSAVLVYPLPASPGISSSFLPQDYRYTLSVWVKLTANPTGYHGLVSLEKNS